MSFSEIVVAMRDLKDLSRNALAQKASVSANWLSLVENEGKLPSDEVIERLEDVLEDSDGELRTAAAQERGFVVVPVGDDSTDLKIKVLVHLQREFPSMSAKSVKALAKHLGV